MNNENRWIVLIVTAFVVLGLFIYFTGGYNQDAETDSLGIPQYQRTLRCEEDEDIVTTLAPHGLPIAFCQQVIDR